MIFGIKTKKDRKIESLQAEIEKLENLLHRRLVVTVYETAKPNTLVVEELVDFDIPVEYAKQSIAHKLAEGIKLYINYEESVDTEFRGKRIRGSLTIVK